MECTKSKTVITLIFSIFILILSLFMVYKDYDFNNIKVIYRVHQMHILQI